MADLATRATQRGSTMLRADGGDCEATLARFVSAGVDLYALATRLQEQGTESFVRSWKQLMKLLESKAQYFSAAKERPSKLA